MSDRRWKRLISMQLALLLTLGAAWPARAAQVIDDGVRPAYDEAYYATTDYYGNLTNGSVVKSYVLRGAESLTDYGVYDEVVNLSDGTAPVRNNEQITFRFGQDAPAHFYFEGKTKAPFERLPWTLKVNYRLNGVPVKAEELSGKTGLVEINVDAVPNETASEYARYNYILTAAAMFNQDDILSLEAPGAQTQLIGNLRAVLFLAFPGEEQHFSIRVGAEAFSFNGLTFMMVPATLSQLDEVAKLSEKKTDLEDSYHELSDSLDTVLDTFNSMQSNLYETANGLDKLDEARRTISSGKGSVYEALDRAQIDLETLAGALSPVTRHAEDAEAFLTDGRKALNALVDTVMQMDGKLSGLEDSMKELESGMGRMENGLSDIESGLAGLEKSLVSVELSLEDTASGADDTASSLTAVDTGLVDLESGLEAMENDVSVTENGLESLEGNLENLSADLERLEGGLKDLEDGSKDVKRILQDAADMETDLNQLGEELDETGIPSRSGGSGSSIGLTQSDLDSVQQIARLYSLTAAGDASNETAFYVAMLTAQGQDEATAATVAGLFVSGNAAVIEAQGLTETYQTLKALYNAPNFQTFAAAILQQRGYSEDEAKTTAKQMEQVWTLYQTPEGAAALELLLSSMNNIDRNISGVANSANDTLSDVSSMAANVMWDLADLCKELDDLIDLVDDARKVSEILRDASGGLRSLTDGLRDTSGDLRTVMDDLRDTSGDLRDTSAALRGASGSLEDTLQSLADLLESLTDASARLRGLSASLRGVSGDAREVSATARAASEKVRGASEVARNALADTDALRKVLNAYEPSARSALETLKSLSGVSQTAIRDANDLIAKTEALFKAGGNQLDAGTKDTLQGLTSTIRKAADGLDSTKDLQSAKNAITDLIEDTWDDYSGDVNNLLNMDSTAEAESLTSARNPAPQSVQILIRTQEIEADDDAETVENAVTKDKGTFLSRIGQMFVDFWNALTGLFH